MRREVLQWAQKITLIFIVVIALSIVFLTVRALGVIPYGQSEAIALTPVPEMPVPTTIGHSEEISDLFSHDYSFAPNYHTDPRGASCHPHRDSRRSPRQ